MALTFMMLCGLSSLVAGDEAGWNSLLPTIQPAAGTVAGEWRKTKDGLATGAATGSRFRLIRPDVAEYDFRIQFTRRSGRHSVSVIFPHGSGQGTFEIDAWGESLAGLQLIDGRDMRTNNRVARGMGLTNGRRYSVTIQVRRDRVRAFVGERMIVEHRSDGGDLTPLSMWNLNDRRALGVGAYESETVFHSLEFRPVSAPTTAASTAGIPTTESPNAGLPTADMKSSVKKSPATAVDEAQDLLTAFSDEFDDAGTRKNWLRIFQVEQSPANQLERFDISRYREGWATMTPYTTSWYQDYRGPLVFKRVGGDFAVTTRVRTTSRAGRGAPRTRFSLAGILVRAPRQVTPQTWRPGQENYIFLAHGSADAAGTYQYEVKTTRNSDSQLAVSDAPGPITEIRIVRVGEVFLLLRRAEGQSEWIVHQRYRRPDMPKQLQVGMTVYTDWTNVSEMPPRQHNQTVIRAGRPDLIASFDFFRFQRLAIPPRFAELDLNDAARVTDQQLLSFLGATLDRRNGQP